MKFYLTSDGWRSTQVVSSRDLLYLIDEGFLKLCSLSNATLVNDEGQKIERPCSYIGKDLTLTADFIRPALLKYLNQA